MKRTFLTTALFIIAIMIYAQDETKPTTSDDGMKTLFSKNANVKLGWFAGIDGGYTQFDGRDAWLGGISGGMIINHHFSIGLTGRAWYDSHNYTEFSDTSFARFVGGYGGLLVEYTLFPKSLVHVTFPVIIGGGGAAYMENWDHNDWNNNNNDYYHNHHTYDSDAFFVVEPGVRAEINILPFMRLNAGVSYRVVAGLELLHTPSDKLSNFTGSIGLKFGKF
jgi:hypothetical protein